MRATSRSSAIGSALSWLHPVKNFMPNGLHAILLAKGPIVRLDMYRFETSYEQRSVVPGCIGLHVLSL